MPRRVIDTETSQKQGKGMTDRIPMTSIQEAYWVGRRHDTPMGGVSTHTFEEINATGMDLERLEVSWNAIVKRHDMLRARVNNAGYIEIFPEVPWYHFAVDDLQDLPAIEQEIHLEAVRNRMREEVIASDTWPIFRVRAAKLGNGQLRIFTSMDALTLDARSRGLLYQEWRQVYEDPRTELPVIKASFAEFAKEIADIPESEAFESARKHWAEKLETMPSGPRLQAARPTKTNGAFIRLEFDHDQETADRIQGTAGDLETASYMYVLAAFSRTLARWSKDPRFHVVLTIFERAARDPRFANTLGDFTTTGLVDCSNEQDEDSEKFIRRLETNLKSTLTNSAYNGVMVSRDAQKKKDAWPDDSVMVVFTNLLGRHHVKEWRSAWIGPALRMNTQTPQVGLDFQLWSLAEGIRISWDFPTNVLDEDTVRAMFADFNAELAQTGRATAPVIVDEHQAERETRPEISERLLTDGVSWHIQNRPDALAIMSTKGLLTYGVLGEQAMGVAHALRTAVPDGEDPVILALPRTREQAIGSIGIILSGRAYVPVHPDWPEDRIEKIVAACGAKSIVALSSFAPENQGLKALARVNIDLVDSAPFEPDTWRADPEDVAYVIFTSGSTGEPKGVAMQHRATMVTIDEINNRFMVDADDCAMGISAMTFDLSVWDVFGMLGAGGRLAIPDESESKDPGAWTRMARRFNVTIWNSVPTLAQLLAERFEDEIDPAPLKTRLFLLSGDWIPVPLPERLRAAAPRCHVVSLGGATEAAIWSVAYEIGHVDPSWRSIPYGRALSRQTIDIRNEQLEALPAGEIGEVVIGGEGLAHSYIGDHELTAARFTTDPEGRRVYRTGDLGRLQTDGNIEFLGRADNQVKIAGYRIELGDVEHAISSHPDVEACLAKAVGPPCGERRLFAYVVTRDGTGSVDELKNHVRSNVPEYMVPAVIRVIDRLPLTSNGKVDRNADLDEMSSEWGDDHTTIAGSGPSTAPVKTTPTPTTEAGPGQDQLVETVRSLAMEILDISEVRAEDSLLDLGASSVDMIRIANRLEMLTGGIRPRLDDIYDTPTPIGIAALVAPMTNPEVETSTVQPITSSQSAVLGVPGANKNPILSTALRNREEVLAFKLKNHGRRNDLDDVEGFNLPDLHPTPDGKRTRTRMTRRLYSQAQLTTRTLAELFHVLRADGSEERRFNYGSSGPTYPISTYFLAKQGRVEGMPEGTYWFDPDANRMVMVGGIGEFGPEAVWGETNKRMLDSAAFGIALVSRHSAIVPVYDRASDRYAILETGFMSQVIEEQAERLDMGVCQVGALDSELFHTDANLQADDIVLNWIVGGMRLESEQETTEFTEEFL
jgi:amino acid adenylation domain-containing protein